MFRPIWTSLNHFGKNVPVIGTSLPESSNELCFPSLRVGLLSNEETIVEFDLFWLLFKFLELPALRPRLWRVLFESPSKLPDDKLEFSSSSEIEAFLVGFWSFSLMFKLLTSWGSTEEALELSMDTSMEMSKEDSSISPFPILLWCPGDLCPTRLRRLRSVVSVCLAADFWK